MYASGGWIKCVHDEKNDYDRECGFGVCRYWPVSYTHLDVYKRQKVMRLIQKEDLRDDKGDLFGFGTHMFRHYYGIKLTEMHLDDRTIAVSYTHLDVYKRQI